MTNNQNPQSKQNVFSKKENLLKNAKTHGGVRQDKARIFPARTASNQPASQEEAMRAQTMNSKTSRSQNSSVPKRRTEQLTLWVKPIVKAELQRIAEREGISVSSVGGSFLEKALQQSIDLQYSALLQPIIEQAITRQMRTISTRLAWLLVRVAFDAGQTRSIVTNILGRQPGVTPDILNTILDGSGKTAKANITRRTPQIVDLIEAVEKWIITREEN